MNVRDVKKQSESFEVPTTFTSFMIQKKGVVNLLKSSKARGWNLMPSELWMIKILKELQRLNSIMHVPNFE